LAQTAQKGAPSQNSLVDLDLTDLAALLCGVVQLRHALEVYRILAPGFVVGVFQQLQLPTKLDDARIGLFVAFREGLSPVLVHVIP